MTKTVDSIKPWASLVLLPDAYDAVQAYLDGKGYEYVRDLYRFMASLESPEFNEGK